MKSQRLRKQEGMGLIELILIIIIILLLILAYKFFYTDIYEFIDGSGGNPIQISTKNVDGVYDKVSSSNNVSGNNHYYYNQLDESGKIIYKALEDNIGYLKLGDYNIDFKKQFNDLLNTPTGEDTLNIAFQSAWNAFTYDYVDIFYIDVSKLILTTKTTKIMGFQTHNVSLSSGKYQNYFCDNIKSTTDVVVRQARIENIRNQIMAQLKGYSNYDKIKHLHNWMIDNIDYGSSYGETDAHNVYGALINKEVVCEGYARAFKYILDGLNIENVLVSGTATNSDGKTESHAWNYVKLDGKWYAIDVTWDDPIIVGGGRLTNTLRYQYFLNGSMSFFDAHKEDGYLSKNSMKFKFPTLERMDY